MILVQLYRVRNTRGYNIRMKVSDGPNGGVFSKTNEIVSEIMSIPGVIECLTDKYEIEVHIAPTFDWREVEESLMPMLVQMNESAGCMDRTIKYLTADGREANQDGSSRLPGELPANPTTSGEHSLAESALRMRLTMGIVRQMRAFHGPEVPTRIVLAWAEALTLLCTKDEEELKLLMTNVSEPLVTGERTKAEDQQPPA